MNKSNNMFKQRRIRFLGEAIDTLFTAMPFLSLFGLISTTIILYETVKSYFLNWAPWLNIWYFIIILALLFIPVLGATYRFVIPSIWHFRSTQMSHLEDKVDNLTRQQLEMTLRIDQLIKKESTNEDRSRK